MALSALQEETTAQRWQRWSNEWKEIAKILSLPSQSERVGRLYDIVGTQNLFGEDSLFINLGYWKNNPATLDEASRDLARLVAEHADFQSTDSVVDVGTGYGDQDILWSTEFAMKEIVGVNVAEEQIAISSRRVQEAGLTDKVRYIRASATDLPFEDGSVDKVVALESPFHFPSRPEFFAQAHRVLKPGGRLVTADIILRAPSNPVLASMNFYFRRLRTARVTSSDSLDINEYRAALSAAGFSHVEVRSIRKDVYWPLGTFLGKRARTEDIRRINPVLRIVTNKWFTYFLGPWMDYIIAEARK